MFTVVALVNGSLWGRPTWGTDWVWDARLASELTLLFLYLGVLRLQRAITNPRRSDRSLRLGGMVQGGSLRREHDGLTVHFVVTDASHAVRVTYRGLLPDLFGEKRGMVALGRLGAAGEFPAGEILAKHDEKYLPPGMGAPQRPTGVDARLDHRVAP